MTPLECATRVFAPMSQPPLTFLSTHLRSRCRSLSDSVFGLRGERAFAKGLKGNSTLRNLIYAAPVARTGRGPVRFFSSAPVGWHASARLCSHARSLSLDKLGPGGGSALAECLSGSSIKKYRKAVTQRVTEVRCARPRLSDSVRVRTRVRLRPWILRHMSLGRARGGSDWGGGGGRRFETTGWLTLASQ